jgi:predicted DNA-binding ribbon-helix-helix protein
MVKFASKIISLNDRKTCMRLTDIEWKILDKICYSEKIKRKNLLELIFSNHSTKLGFTPSVRLFALLYVYQKSRPTRTIPPLQKALSRLK